MSTCETLKRALEESIAYEKNIVKCNNCLLRYHCDEQTEWNCKNDNYRNHISE